MTREGLLERLRGWGLTPAPTDLEMWRREVHGTVLALFAAVQHLLAEEPHTVQAGALGHKATERGERLRAMRDRLHEPLSDQTGATLGIKGRAGIVLAELLDFLASEEPAVAIRPVESAELGGGLSTIPLHVDATIALEEARATLWAILRAKGRKITQAEQDDLERWATAAIASIEKALGLGEQSKLRTGPITMPRDAAPGLAPGDVVRLASGGPAMTVVRKRPEELEEIGGWFVCAYYQESTMEQRSVTLPPAALRRVEDEQRAEQERRGLLGVVRGQHRILDRAYAALEQIEPLLAGDLRHEASRESLAALKKDIFSALEDS